MEKIVSIIIPAYNVENYIFRGLESCINQTYKNIEILVIDDGSIDKTYEIVHKYCLNDNRIKLIKKTNGGVSSARNEGLRQAKGKYVLFLDSDDWLENNTVEILINTSRKYEDLLISCDRYWLYENKDNLKKIKPFKNKKIDKISSEEALINVGNGKYNLQSACYKIYDLNKIKRNNIFFKEDIFYGEDGLFVFEYLKIIKGMIYLPIGLWNILERRGSATQSNYNSKMLSAIDGVKKMLSYENNSLELTKILRLYLVQRIESIIEAILESTDKTDLKKLRKVIKENKSFILKNKFPLKEKIKCIFYAYTPYLFLMFFYKIIKKLKKSIKNIYYIINI